MRFRDWKIRNKILAGFFINIVFIGILGILSYLGMNKIVYNEMVLLSDSDMLANTVLEMHLAEPEFLEHDRNNIEFFETGESEYLIEYETNYVKFNTLVEEIKKHEVIVEIPENRKLLEKIDDLAEEYHNGFMAVVEKIRTRGYKDYGCVGELREAIYEVEKELENIPNNEVMKIALLEARRMEKNYLLRQEEQYVELFKIETLKFKGLIEGTEYDEVTKANLVSQVKSYEEKFDKVVDIDMEVGLDAHSGLMGQYKEKMHQLLPLVEQLHVSIVTLINSEANSMRNSNRMIIGAVVLISIIAALYIARLISKPIIKLVDLMAIAEKGDLTVYSDISTKDEVGRLSKSFNKMIDGQKATVIDVEKASKIVKESADVTSSSTEELAAFAMNQSEMVKELTTAAGEVVTSVVGVSTDVSDIAGVINDVSESTKKLGHSADEIAKNTEHIVKTVADVTKSLNELDKSTEVAATNADHVKAEAQKTVGVAVVGKETVKNTIEEIEIVNITIDELQQVVRGLGQAAMEIGDIVEVIDDIAEQTNLLSLNASIEAARAGEHGKGFAVVAEAIGKLAEKSSESTKEISSLISAIQIEVKNAIEVTDKGVHKVEIGVALVKDTGDAFENIYTVVSKNTEMMKSMVISINEQSKASNKIMQAIKQVNELSVNFASEVEEQVTSINEVALTMDNLEKLAMNIAESSEEQSASGQQMLATIEDLKIMTMDEATASEEVAKSAEELAVQACKMLDVVNTFKVND